MPPGRLFMKFTDRSIQAIKPKAERFEAWEDNGKGFGLRVGPSGKKSWIYLYRFEGRARRMTLGEYPGMSLADAHEEHAKAKKALSKGTDPGEKEQAQKAAHKNAFTVKDLVDEYMERHAKRNKVTWREDLRCLNKDIIPFIGKRKAKDIKNRDIVLVRDRIIDRGADAMANRTHNILTKLFNFAVERGILDASPCAALTLPAEKGERDRALDFDEIKVFWNGLDDSDMEPVNKLALKFLLVTDQRRSEVVKSEWEEFNLHKREWEIPVERIKTRKRKKKKKIGPHMVPLSDLAVGLLEKIKELSGNSPFLFPSSRTGRSIDPPAVTRALRWVLDEKYKDRIKVEYFTVHDLRRTAATGMAEIGISRFNIQRVLNHEEGDTADRYIKYQYFPEKKDALHRWGRKLEAIISGETAKVIELRK